MVDHAAATTESRGVKMVRKIGAAVLCAGALMAASGQESDIKYKPLSIAGLAEMGSFQGARYGDNAPLDNEWVDHFGVFITQSAEVSERTSFDIGLGGIFQFFKREDVNSRWFGTQWKAFFIGPTVADIRHGSLHAGEGLGLQFGRFNYKYNADATNLGEYLFRAGAYPTFLFGGGYSIIGVPEARLQGLRLNYTRGGLSADLMVVTENAVPALYDFSVAGLVGYKIGDGLMEIGAGVNLKRAIPVRPSKTTRPIDANAFFTRNNTVYTGYTGYYTEQANFYRRRSSESLADSAAFVALAEKFEDLVDSLSNDNKLDVAANPGDTILGWKDSATGKILGAEYYTQKAILLMAHASVDFKKLIGGEAFGPNDLRFSIEANLLGTKNYPIFYKNVTERMPITASFNLPGFRILDLISLQVEYFNSPWVNGYGQLLRDNSATPTIVSGGDKERNKLEFNDITKNDNLSWSLLIKKNLAGSGWASVQAARDHSRNVSKDYWGGPGLEPTELLGTEKDWYLMVQFGFGI